jgi:Fic family protein
MSTLNDFVTSIQASANGISLAQLLAKRPDISRRTAQRWISQLILEGRIQAIGEGRARHYFPANANLVMDETVRKDKFPENIPLSTDSVDILNYINKPLAARHPVGYQQEFLESYYPNKTWYLSSSLRRQLHQMGNTVETEAPAGTYSRAILNRLLIDLSWASSQLEGNTYSLLDTVELIKHGKVSSDHTANETQMILNHKTAIELMVENVDTIGFDRHTIMNLHSVLSENLLPDPANEGQLRQHPVGIGKSVFRPLSVPQKISSEFDLLLQKATQINDPFEQSFFMMVHLPYLQPFADINKRTSRLAANLPLFRANLCPLTFIDVPEEAYSRAILGVYELTRVELLRDLYVWAYQRSTREYLTIKKDLVEPDPLRLAYRNLIKKTIHDVVIQPEKEPFNLIRQSVIDQVENTDERADVQALIIEELKRIHDGVLARYGLRPSDLANWKARN